MQSLQNKIKATWLYGLLQQQKYETSIPIIYLQYTIFQSSTIIWLEIIKLPR